jgi:hypothetical protein
MCMGDDAGKGAGWGRTRIFRTAGGHGGQVQRWKGVHGRAVEQARVKLQGDGRAAKDRSSVGDGGFTPHLRFVRIELSRKGNLPIWSPSLLLFAKIYL